MTLMASAWGTCRSLVKLSGVWSRNSSGYPRSRKMSWTATENGSRLAAEYFRNPRPSSGPTGRQAQPRAEAEGRRPGSKEANHSPRLKGPGEVFRNRPRGLLSRGILMWFVFPRASAFGLGPGLDLPAHWAGWVNPTRSARHI